MIDPARPESKESVKTAKEARIKTVMITGDLTASAYARVPPEDKIRYADRRYRACPGCERSVLHCPYEPELLVDYAEHV